MPAIPAPTEALNWYQRLHAIDMAIARRWHALGSFRWPFYSHEWVWGTVGAGDVTETSLSTGLTLDTTKDSPWNDPPNGVLPTNKDAHDTTRIPSTWRLVFDDCEPDNVVIARITAIADAGTLNFGNIRDYVTAAVIPSVSSLEGRRWNVINGAYGVWSSERLYPWPNAREWARGTIRAYHDDPANPTTVTNPTNHSIKDDRPEWRAAEVTGKDLLVYATDADGRLLRRVTITAADDEARTMTFAAQAWTPEVVAAPNALAYCVVAAGARAIPGRTPAGDNDVGARDLRLSAPPCPFEHYYGIRKGYNTHAPASTGGGYIGSIPKAEATFTMPGEGTGLCAGTIVGAWYADLWEAFPLATADADCPGTLAEYPHTPRLFWTWGGRQWAIETALEFVGLDGTGFVEDKNYDTATAIPIRGMAETFLALGINSFTATTTTVTVSGMSTSSNVINFSAAAFPSDLTYPHEVYFNVRRADGSYNKGFGVATSATSITGDPAAPDVFTVAADQGRPITITLGWTRFTERWHAWMFPATYFLPDTQVVDGTPTAIDPPEILDFAMTDCLGAGKWYRRPRSSNYLVADLNQSEDADRGNKGRIQPGPVAFENGKYSRYVGDNHAFPSIENLGREMVGTVDPLTPYYDHPFVGRHPPAVQALIDEQLTGRATGGSLWQLEDTSKDWLDPKWYSGGVLRTEAITFTSGSTTGGSDSSKTGGAANCWWQADRFLGWVDGTGWVAGGDGCDPYRRFTVQALISGTDFDDPEAVIETRFITSGNGTTATLGWDEPTSVSVDGKQGRIQEPRYAINRYEGRPLKMTRPDPANPGAWQTQTVTLRGNHRNHLFFAAEAAWAPDATTTYEIQDPATGTVWKWDSSGAGAWVKPVGADAARLGNGGVPADFHPNQLENMPTIVKRYGRALLGDIMCRTLFDEVIAVLLAMKCTVRSFNWIANTAGTNHYNARGGNDEAWGPTNNYADAQDDLTANWTPGGTTEDNLPPMAMAVGRKSLTDPLPMWIDAERAASYGSLHVPQPFCPIENTIKWYAKATLDDPGAPVAIGPPVSSATGSECFDNGDGRHTWRQWAFDGQGDPVLYQQYKAFATDATPSTTEDRISPVKLGTMATGQPAQAPEPVPGACFTPTTDGGATDDYFMFSFKGYTIPAGAEYAKAVICWAFDDLPAEGGGAGLWAGWEFWP
jgi:hypothetical protein